MRWTGRSRQTIFDGAFLGGACMLAFYFALSAVQGEFGIARLYELEAEEVALEQRLDELVQTREALENKTKRLSDEFLDLDLLDEQARKTLGLIRPDEIILK